MSNAGFSSTSPSPVLVALEEARNSPLIADVRPTARWKRLVGFIILSAVLMFAAMLAAAFVSQPLEAIGLIPKDILGAVPEGPNRLYGEIVSALGHGALLGLMAGAILLSAMITYRAPATAFLWPGRAFSQRQLWLGFAVMSAVGALGLLIYNLIDPAGPPPILNSAYSVESRLVYVVAAALGLFVAAAAEEVVFRGVLLRITGGFTGSVVILCLFNAVVFSAVHLDPDPVAFVARALSGFIWTWAALRLGGLEFAIGAHWAGNLMLALLGEPLSTGAVSEEPAPLSALAYEIVALIIIFAVVERMVRARRGQSPA